MKKKCDLCKQEYIYEDLKPIYIRKQGTNDNLIRLFNININGHLYQICPQCFEMLSKEEMNRIGYEIVERED